MVRSFPTKIRKKEGSPLSLLLFFLFKKFLLYFFPIFIVFLFHYHLVPLCPPPPAITTLVHESFFLFAQSFHPLLFNITPQVLANALPHAKELRDMKTGKEDIQLSLSADDMTMHNISIYGNTQQKTPGAKNK